MPLATATALGFSTACTGWGREQRGLLKHYHNRSLRDVELTVVASIKTTFIATAIGLFEEFHIWLTVTTGFLVSGMISLLNP